MASVQEATARTNARIASKKAGTVDRGALDKLAAQTGGKAQYDKGRVEYQVKGAGYKATRYARPGETPDMEASSSRRSGKGEINPRGDELAGVQTPEQLATDTSQPSPENVDAQPFTGASPMQSYEQATQALSAGGLSGDTLAQARSIVDSKYQKAHQQLTSSGTPPPADGGEAMSQVYGATPYEADKTAMNAIFDQDPVINSIMQEAFTFLQPQERKTSLMDDYKKLYRSSGLDEINEELIDAETVLDGTEDDIRREIAGAGGMGTESQVQAMVLARNKGLLKRYNQLFSMRDSAQKQLDTMLTINQQDRQMAQQESQDRLNVMFKLADFKQQALNATRETFNSLVSKVGYSGALEAYSANPQQLGYIERAMGLGAGGLEKLAAQPDYNMQSQKLEVQLKQEQLAKAYQELDPASGAGMGTLNGKPQTETQAMAQGYGDRMAMANIVISGFGNKFASNLAIGGMLPSFMQSSERQQYEQGKRDFVNAVLRKESGATITPDEFDNAQKQYFPQTGDSKETVKQKEVNRNTAINNIYRASNVQRPAFPGDIVESDGKKYRVANDGETLMEI